MWCLPMVGPHSVFNPKPWAWKKNTGHPASPGVQITGSTIHNRDRITFSGDQAEVTHSTIPGCDIAPYSGRLRLTPYVEAGG